MRTKEVLRNTALGLTLAGVLVSTTGCEDKEGKQLTAAIQADGFDKIDGHWTGGSHEASFGSLFLGHCEFHDVDATYSDHEKRITEVHDYRFKMGSIAILNAKHQYVNDEGGLTIHVNSAAEIRSTFPDLHC